MLNYEDYCQAADLLRSRIGGFSPEVLLILGTGVGYLAEHIADPVVVPYGEVPHMPVSTASSHAGNFVFGSLAGRRVMAMQGTPPSRWPFPCVWRACWAAGT